MIIRPLKQRTYRYSHVIQLSFLYLVLAFSPIHQPFYKSYIVDGTTIIGYVKNNTVWVGTDSRRTVRNIVTSKTYFIDTSCKIFTGKNIIVAKAGWAGDSGGILNINKIIQSALNKQLAVEKTIGLLDSTLRSETKIFFQENTDFRDTSLSYSLLFACFKSGTTALIGDQFIVKFDSVGIINVFSHFLPPFKYADKSRVLPLGHCNYIKDDIFDGIFLKSKNVPATIEWLIRKEMRFDSLVGGDVNIVRMSEGRIKWIKQKQYCK